MITKAEYTQIWAEANLVRYSRVAVNNLSISDDSKQFLVEYGLPCNTKFYFPAQATGPTLPFVESVCFDAMRVPDNFRQMHLIGTRCLMDGYPTHYGISELYNGSIFAVHDVEDGEIEVCFASSSVQQYGELVLRLEQWQDRIYYMGTSLSGEEKLAIGQQLAVCLRDIDRAACDLETSGGFETEFGAAICQIEHTGWTG